jgi:hypothetical protein
MSDAVVLEIESTTAGILVRQRRGVTFYASESRFFALDGKMYRSINDARIAVTDLLRAQKAVPLARPRRAA